MTLSDQFLTLIAFPFCFVIQLVTIDKVVSNYLISGDDIISNYPIGWRGVSLANTPSGDNLVPCHPGLQSSVNELRICNHEWSEDLIKAVKTVQQYVTVGSLAYQRLRIIEPFQGSFFMSSTSQNLPTTRDYKSSMTYTEGCLSDRYPSARSICHAERSEASQMRPRGCT